MVHQDLKWSDYILHDENSLLRILSNRVNGLKKVCYAASFKQRKTVADGIFMSKLIYMIQVWGGCENYLLKSLQIIQNKAARVVTKLKWDTPVGTLLSQCGWLSIRQLIWYHSVILVHRIRLSKVPKYLYNMYNFNEEKNVQTRQTGLKLISLKNMKAPKSELVRRGFRWRSFQDYNLLPLDIRSIATIDTFKKRAKIWANENISPV